MTEPTTNWTPLLEAIDRAFDVPRPEKFTNHPYCEECADADDYFQAFDPTTFAEVTDGPETLPLSFLTADAFLYLWPAMARWITRSGEQYCLGDVLFHLENRLDTFTPEQKTDTRDLLYAVYDALKPEIEASAFDYECLWRILNGLDEATSSSS